MIGLRCTPIQLGFAVTMPVIKLVAVSLATLEPSKANIATAGRTAIPPPTMKPAAAAIATEGSGLSRIDFSICSKSRLRPNVLSSDYFFDEFEPGWHRWFV
jgi:hypothetical protein